MDLNHNLVKGCPLCGVFLQPSDKVIKKLYYPSTIEEIDKVDFIIIGHIDYKTPLIVIRDHVSDISKEIWGRMLYKVRGLFGNVRLRYKLDSIGDHYHCCIIRENKDAST